MGNFIEVETYGGRKMLINIDRIDYIEKDVRDVTTVKLQGDDTRHSIRYRYEKLADLVQLKNAFKDMQR